MIAEGKEAMFYRPWLVVLPGMCLFVLVIAANLTGDGFARHHLAGGEELMPLIKVENLSVRLAVPSGWAACGARECHSSWIGARRSGSSARADRENR